MYWVGALIGWAAELDIKKILFLGVTMGAVMELIPRITSLFIEGLKPISEKTQELVKSKFNGKKVHIGMSPALVIGHPTTLVSSIILIPVILAIAVFLPGNQFLPLASLAGMFYLFPMILPFTKGNVVMYLQLQAIRQHIFLTDSLVELSTLHHHCLDGLSISSHAISLTSVLQSSHFSHWH